MDSEERQEAGEQTSSGTKLNLRRIIPALAPSWSLIPNHLENKFGHCRGGRGGEPFYGMAGVQEQREEARIASRNLRIEDSEKASPDLEMK
jgi:hypothetical protein